MAPLAFFLLFVAASPLVTCALADGGKSPPARRLKANKYAQFSKADEVRRSLRFSNVDDAFGDEVTAEQAKPTAEPLREREKWAYPDAAQVDQRDPTTFGFTEIGVVLGAHGTRGELKVLSDSDFAHERLCHAGPTWMRRPRRRAPREERVLRGRKGPGTNVFLVTIESVRSREAADALKGSTLHVRRELRPELGEDEFMLWELEGLKVYLALAVGKDGVAREEASSASAEGHASAPMDGAVTGATGSRSADTTSSVADGALAYVAGAFVGVVSGLIPREELTGSRELGNDLLEITLCSSVRGATAEGEDEDDENDVEDASVDDADDEDSDVSASDHEGGEAGGDEEDGDEDESVLVPYVPQIVVDVRLSEGYLLIDPPKGLLKICIQPKRRVRVVIRGLLPERAQSLLVRESSSS
ncbi:16s rRNA processing protein [Chrysochromulina tobinii]|uniref:16s rRNA processing protein n=1 Tax=Chrysochromulina tobinii TaxID=1460289 RepID=A0A0M0J685_9EUKA|nr:16s rRNA processing protein [Chrysochromulina tobinii]|eukprot:KOO21847.1 16s rRNA processing protein [Chrysochromulina sp. CCMP291]